MRSRRAAIMTVLFPCLWACSEPPSTVSMVIGRYSFGPEGWDGIEVEWTAGGSTRVFDAGDFVQTDFNSTCRRTSNSVRPIAVSVSSRSASVRTTF
jgi:hypothetical protein